MKQATVEPRIAHPVSAADRHLNEVRSDAMAELLDEQERADKERFRGLRRGLRNPPSMEEMVAFLSEHKLFTVVSVLAFFFVIEYLRERELILALAFGAAGLGLSIAGLKRRLADGVLYQAFAWCYLLVLCAFPIVLANKEELGLAGTTLMQNPVTVAATPSLDRALPISGPPTPASSLEAGNAAEQDAGPIADVDEVSGDAVKQTAPAAAAENALPKNPPGAPAEDSVNDPPSNSAKPTPIVPDWPGNATPPATSETFRQMAERAFGEADTRGAFRDLHADAVASDDSDVWRFVRWNRRLNRPAVGIRWGVGVDYNNLAIQLLDIHVGQNQGPMTIDAQKNLAIAFHKQTIPAGTTVSLGMLVSNRLRDCHDQGLFGDSELIPASKERGLRGATYLGADTPAELQRAARLQELDFLFVFDVRAAAGAAGQPKLSTGVRIMDVANGADIYPLPKQKPLALRKEVEAALDYLESELRLGEIPERVDPAALQSRFKAAINRKPENSLALLMALRWCQREKTLPPSDVENYMSNLVGPADAAVLTGGSDAERAKLVRKWVTTH